MRAYWILASVIFLGFTAGGAAFPFQTLYATSLGASLILVSDEVGLGVVPESDAGRSFRDLLGLANQRAAAAAEEVRLCVAGIGMRVK